MNAAPPVLEDHEIEHLYRQVIGRRDPAQVRTPEAAVWLMARLLPHLGPASAPLARNFAAFLNRSPAMSQVQSALAQLLAQLEPERLAPFHEACDADLFDSCFPLLFDAAATARQSGARSVLFVATTPYFLILREAMELRRLGWRPMLVTLAPVPEHLDGIFREHFDAVVCVEQSAPLLASLLARLEVDVVHVQCWMFAYWLGRLAIDSRRSNAVICEFYDVTSIYASREALCTLWPAPQVDFDLAMERYILRHADGIVHRFPPRSVARWGARMGAMPPNVEMHGFACPQFLRYRPRPELLPGQPIRLVYAGGLIPQNADHPEGLFPERHQPQTFAALLRQGLRVDVYHNPHRRLEEDPGMMAFVQLARQYAEFGLHQGVSPDRLAATLVPYDFGLILTQMDRQALMLADEVMDGCVGTKLFAYLEAGLPVIVNAEYHEMARIVTENDVGLAVHSQDIPSLGERLRAFDRAAAVARIRAFNIVNGMNRRVHDLTALYEQTVAANLAPGEGVISNCPARAENLERYPLGRKPL